MDQRWPAMICKGPRKSAWARKWPGGFVSKREYAMIRMYPRGAKWTKNTNKRQARERNGWPRRKTVIKQSIYKGKEEDIEITKKHIALKYSDDPHRPFAT